MATSSRRLAVALAEARASRNRLADDLRQARLNSGLSQLTAAKAVGMSHAQLGRIERGELERLTIDQVIKACAAVGLGLSVRTYPMGDPARDAGQLALLERLRRVCATGMSMRTEVPVGPMGDLRAWDAVVRCSDGSFAVEAETRLVDLQAQERRVALKLRDGAFDRVILVVADTANNRRMLAAHREVLRGLLPLDPREVLRALRAGQAPSASGIVVL